MAKADVGTNVTLFGQESGFFCGEANAQMARNGYPNPGDRICYSQIYLRNIIEAFNSNSAADKDGWNTDPQGLRECLQLLSSAPLHWIECASAVRQETQLFIHRCVQQSEFPTPVLVHGGQHWVLVVGWETEAPLADGSQALKHIRYYDPEPVGHGTDVTVAGSTWNRSKRFSKVGIQGTWIDKFVAVGQRS